MLRLAISAFVLIVAVLVVLSLLPEKEIVNPDDDVQLYNSRMTLYPQQDPAAIWRFAADTVSYNPVSRESTLFDLSEGARWLDDAIDFSLASEEMVIDNEDNIRSDAMLIHITDMDWDLHMTAKDARPVYISQSEGKFYAPRYTASGEGLGAENIEENVSLNFDLTEFVAGGPGTVGINSFVDTVDN